MAKTKENLKIFISYSHVDMKFKNELLKHLKTIELTYNVDVWHDGKIHAGGNIDREVLNYLNLSNIILLLVSPNFLSSRYCIEEELKIAMERYANGECIIVPVILSECLIDDDLCFSRLLRVPDDGKPIQKFRPQNNGYINALANIKNLIDAKYTEARKPEVKEPTVPISINLYQNGEPKPYVIDDFTWKTIITIKDRINSFQKVMNEKLVTAILTYKHDFPKAKKEANLTKFRHDALKSFVLDISLTTREWLFRDVGVRIHFRILNRDKYIGFVVVDGKANTNINVNWANKITPMSTTSGMIYHSGELDAPLIKSKNELLHDAGKHDDIYVDYVTSAFKFKEMINSANPIMSMGISIEKEFNKKYAPYLIALVFLNFDIIVQDLIKVFCSEINKIDKAFELNKVI